MLYIWLISVRIISEIVVFLKLIKRVLRVLILDRIVPIIIVIIVVIIRRGMLFRFSLFRIYLESSYKLVK